ncbi:hypothetical protein KCU69_g38, partial [Aureobasidium melanogenum]
MAELVSAADRPTELKSVASLGLVAREAEGVGGRSVTRLDPKMPLGWGSSFASSPTHDCSQGLITRRYPTTRRSILSTEKRTFITDTPTLRLGNFDKSAHTLRQEPPTIQRDRHRERLGSRRGWRLLSPTISSNCSYVGGIVLRLIVEEFRLQTLWCAESGGLNSTAVAAVAEDGLRRSLVARRCEGVLLMLYRTAGKSLVVVVRKKNVRDYGVARETG